MLSLSGELVGEGFHGAGLAAVVADGPGEQPGRRACRLAFVGVGHRLEDAVADVEVAAAGHRHVQLAAAGAFVVEGAAAVDGEALHAGDRRRVGELDVFGDVARREEHPVAPAFADDGERPVGVPFGDLPHRPVDDLPVGLGADPGVVVTGHDAVPDPGPGAVTQTDPAGLDLADPDADGAGGAGELGDGVVVPGDHHRAPPGAAGRPTSRPRSPPSSRRGVPPRSRSWSS